MSKLEDYITDEFGYVEFKDVNYLVDHIKSHPEDRNPKRIEDLYYQVCNIIEAKYSNFERIFSVDLLYDMISAVMRHTYSDDTFTAISLQDLQRICQNTQENMTRIKLSGLPWIRERIMTEVYKNASSGRDKTYVDCWVATYKEVEDTTSWLKKIGMRVEVTWIHDKVTFAVGIA